MTESISILDSESVFSAATSDGVPEETVIVSDDPTCEVCGTALVYAGRGRKPTRCDEHKRNKSSNSGTRSSAKGSTRDVTAAASALKTLNSVVAVPLMMVAPSAGKAWSDRLPALEAQTLTILESDPALARRLAAAGSKGGTLALTLAYGMNLIPVLAIARQEMEDRRIATVEEFANDNGAHLGERF